MEAKKKSLWYCLRDPPQSHFSDLPALITDY